jgi:hypothetical protein
LHEAALGKAQRPECADIAGHGRRLRSAVVGPCCHQPAPLVEQIAALVGGLNLVAFVRRALPSGNTPMIGQALAKIAGEETRLVELVRIAMETTRAARSAVA